MGLQIPTSKKKQKVFPGWYRWQFHIFHTYFPGSPFFSLFENRATQELLHWLPLGVAGNFLPSMSMFQGLDGRTLSNVFIRRMKWIYSRNVLLTWLWKANQFHVCSCRATGFPRLRQWILRSNTKFFQTEFQLNRAPKALPHTSAWPGKMTCCGGC